MRRYTDNLTSAERKRIDSVRKTLENFADQIGYKGSHYRNEFINYLNSRYGFLSKFAGFSHRSRFWSQNSKSLIKKDEDIRQSLKSEILQRRNPVERNYQTDHLNINSISSFVFCPVSFAINLTYESEEPEEILNSGQLQNEKLFEEFLSILRRNRQTDYIFNKMEVDRDSFSSWEIDNVDEEKQIFHITAKKNKRWSSRNDIDKNIQIDKSDFDNFCNRDEYGELLTSEITFKRYEHKIEEPFFSKDKKISGIPDYILTKPDGEKFILLEKHTWRKQIITRPYSSHLMQAAGYLNSFPQLNASYAYILYLHNVKVARLFKVTLDSGLKEDFSRQYDSAYQFFKEKELEFDFRNINTDKCFSCGVRMYCSHKNGKLNKITLPYKITE